MKTKANNKLFGASLLVAGTAIGAGMLALPTVTGFAGFIPTAFLFLSYWLFMLFTSFLILEVNLWMKDRANMISMAKETLGPLGELIAWGAYLFLLYALMTAYLAGSGPIVTSFIQLATGIKYPDWVGFVPLLGIFAYFVIMGTTSVDYLNRLLMAFMGVLFFWIVGYLLPHVEWTKLVHVDFPAVTMAISVAATSFGFHIIIPSLTDYLERDVVKIRHSLVIGSLIPLIIYLAWEAVTLGTLPLAHLKIGYENGSTGSEILAGLLNSPLLSLVANIFALCAIVTSFLGVSMSLSSCIADGLHLRKIKVPAGAVDALAFIPPLMIALIDPRAFLNALEYAGVYGVIILLALLPALMVYSGRYKKNLTGPFVAPGGKWALYVVIFFSITLIIWESL